jgi:hypothetical protein
MTEPRTSLTWRTDTDGKRENGAKAKKGKSGVGGVKTGIRLCLSVWPVVCLFLPRKGLQRKAHRICGGKSEDLERKARLVAILKTGLLLAHATRVFGAKRQKCAQNFLYQLHFTHRAPNFFLVFPFRL